MSTVPKYRKHKASGQAVVTLGGRDHYLGPYGTKVSHQEYDRLVGEWLAAGRPKAASRVAATITVTEIIAAFWQHAKSYYRRGGKPTGTHEKYRPRLRLLRARYGRTAAADFGPLALQALRQAMIELGHSRGYINESIHLIRNVFRWAASQELVAISVYQQLTSVKALTRGKGGKERPTVQPVEDEIVDATLPFLPAVVADMVRLQRLTAARPGEICALRPCDIERDGPVWRYRVPEHKNLERGSDRVIYLGPKAQQTLLPYLQRAPQDYCFSPQEAVNELRRKRNVARVTPPGRGNSAGKSQKSRPKRSAGTRYTNNSYRRAVERACQQAFTMPKELRKIDSELDPKTKADLQVRAMEWRRRHVWSPNQLRHAAATEIRNAFGIEAAQVSLGHSRLETTQIYAERSQNLAVSIAQQRG